MKSLFRVKKEKDFKKILDGKKQVKSPIFSLFYLPNTLGYSRVGISTSKKLGNAVTRNRVRRQIREMISKILTFKESIDYIVIAREEFTKKDFQDNFADLTALMKRTRRL